MEDFDCQSQGFKGPIRASTFCFVERCSGVGHLHGQLIDAERQVQLMQRNELQATGTTAGKVLLDVVAILWRQIRLLKTVDVSCDFIVHRDACLEQNGNFEKHAGLSNRPSFSL